MNAYVFISYAVPGHEGKLIFSTMGERQVPVVLLVGRAQYVASIYHFTQTQSISVSSHSLIFFQTVSTKAIIWRP